jgi:hypothetical protein
MGNPKSQRSVIRFTKDHLFWCDFVVFLLLLFGTIVRLQGSPHGTLDRSIRLLKSNDSVRVLANSVNAHNSTLIGVLEGRLASAGTLDASRADTRMQARVFYAAILAGLMLFVFREDHRMKRRVGLFLLVLTSVMYALDVHLDDLNKRQLDAASVLGSASKTLFDKTPSDTTWFELEFGPLEREMEKASETAFLRKSQAATRPNLEQIIYYFFPWFVVYGFTRHSLTKRTPT